MAGFLRRLAAHFERFPYQDEGAVTPTPPARESHHRVEVVETLVINGRVMAKPESVTTATRVSTFESLQLGMAEAARGDVVRRDDLLAEPANPCTNCDTPATACERTMSDCCSRCAHEDQVQGFADLPQDAGLDG